MSHCFYLINILSFLLKKCNITKTSIRIINIYLVVWKSEISYLITILTINSTLDFNIHCNHYCIFDIWKPLGLSSFHNWIYNSSNAMIDPNIKISRPWQRRRGGWRWTVRATWRIWRSTWRIPNHKWHHILKQPLWPSLYFHRFLRLVRKCAGLQIRFRVRGNAPWAFLSFLLVVLGLCRWGFLLGLFCRWIWVLGLRKVEKWICEV